jgi:hypothetical protein
MPCNASSMVQQAWVALCARCVAERVGCVADALIPITGLCQGPP